MSDAERQRLERQIAERSRELHARSWRAGPPSLPPDVTLQQLRVLGLVAQSSGITSNELGQLLGVSAPTCSGLVERLADKGLVVRTEDDSDRRVRRLHLTEQGTEVLTSIETSVEQNLAKLTPLFTNAELGTLLAGYEVVLRVLDRVNPSQPID